MALLAATAALLGSGAGPRMITAQSRAKEEPGVDASIRPGDDFFGYANGVWLKRTEIPAGAERWNARSELDALSRQQMGKLLDEASAAPAGSLTRLVADYRSAFLNEAAIEARGLTSLTPMLDSIDQVRDKAGLTRLLGRWLRADVDPLNVGVYQSGHLLGLSVEEGNHGEKRYVAYLLQGGLGLADREQYLSAEPAVQAQRTAYQLHVGRQLGLVGVDRPGQRADAVMALETAIAKSQASRAASATDRNADSGWTRVDFSRRAPGMDWAAFFAAAGLARQESFVAWQPSAVTGAAALVASQPIEAWKDYLRVRLLDRYAEVLPQSYAGDAAAASKPRAQKALEATQSALGEAMGKMYVDRYFASGEKARIRTIGANVIAALGERVAALTWMAPATKIVALAKLKSLYNGIGYPEQWQDYADLTVDPTDPLGNLRRVADRDYRRAVARLGKPVDRSAWMIAPQTVGAILTFQLNATNFAAALLQAPKFDLGASDASNYGAIGAILGHESSHYIDLLGADYREDGSLSHWWTADDHTRFQAIADRLDEQFSGYRPFSDLPVNGKQTQSENVADLAGLNAAFDAHRRALGVRISDQAYVRRQDREFFIGFAASWRGEIRDGALRALIATNDHAPERYRVATVRNLDAWYDAFDVRPGDQLYLEPKARVRIW